LVLLMGGKEDRMSKAYLDRYQDILGPKTYSDYPNQESGLEEYDPTGDWDQSLDQEFDTGELGNILYGDLGEGGDLRSEGPDGEDTLGEEFNPETELDPHWQEEELPEAGA
ncbi:MAG: hypothetical protein R3351_05200, partial [Nitrospirales bacterium]|nr:hypothetical protein [Nitrospirales bacterium]